MIVQGLNISGIMAKAKDLKFCTLVCQVKFNPCDDKLSLKLVWSQSRSS